MKKIATLILLLSIGITYSQVNFGMKAGLNYNANNDLNVSSGGFLPGNENFSSEAKIGFVAGLYGTIDLGKIYVQPEFLFSQTNSSYDQYPDFTLSYLEIPVLVGYNIINSVSIYAGPSVQFILDNKFFSTFDLDFEKKAALMINVGVNVRVGKFGLDLRYLKGMSNNLAIYDNRAVDGPFIALNAKPSQLALSFSYQLN